MSDLKTQITEDMKASMRSGDKARLGVIRMLQAAIKQREVDERIVLDDAAVTAVITKMIKQRRDSISQYESAGRQELADQEAAEISVLEAYMPQQMTEAEVESAIAAALAESGATAVADMGRVMAILKPRLQGRADIGRVSGRVRQRLS